MVGGLRPRRGGGTREPTVAPRVDPELGVESKSVAAVPGSVVTDEFGLVNSTPYRTSTARANGTTRVST